MAEPKKLREVLATQVAPEFQKVAADAAAANKRLKALGEEVKRSKDAGVRRALAVAVKAVDIEGDRVGALIVRLRKLLDILKKLETHPEFADNAAAIVAMTNKLDEFKDSLTTAFAGLKRYEREVGGALELLGPDPAEVAEEWAVVVEDVKKRIAEEKKGAEKMLVLRAQIEAALDARDAKQLTTLQAQSLDIRGVSADRSKESREQIEKGRKLAVDASLKAQIEREADQLGSEQAHWNIRIVNVHANHKNAAIEPIDPKKAAAILDIPTTHHTKLAAALALDLVSMTKELGLLAKALKRTTPGKELVALLRKAKLFERKPLVAPAFK
jgi:hypothetical protein